MRPCNWFFHGLATMSFFVANICFLFLPRLLWNYFTRLIFLFAVGACQAANDVKEIDVAVGLSNPQLAAYMTLERAQPNSIAIEGDMVKFNLSGDDALVHGGVRSEVAVDYPFNFGDHIRYEFKFMLPDEFLADSKNRWWLIAQWHDQPNINEGEGWLSFPLRSPPVSLYLEELNGVLGVGVNYLITGEKEWFPVKRGVWNKVAFDFVWRNDAGGELVFLLNDIEPKRFTGPNMHNDFQHYLKFGMYRHAEIRTGNYIFFKELSVREL